MSIGITDLLAPLGEFPIVEDTNFKGGYQSISDVSARDAIPANKRKIGMQVYTVATAQLWVLYPDITNSSWALAANGAAVTSSAPVNVTKAAAAVGVATDAARADHKHDVTTAAASGLTHQATSSEGSATTLARSDHVHGFVAPAAPVNVTKAAAAAGSSTNVAREDHKHDITTAAPVNVTKTANAEGTATSLARSDHKHDVSTAAPTTGIGAANSEGSATTLARSDHSHALRTTTGPTDLGIGAIADGDFLKRSGTSIIGGSATPATGSVTAAMQDEMWSVVNGDFTVDVNTWTTAKTVFPAAQDSFAVAANSTYYFRLFIILTGAAGGMGGGAMSIEFNSGVTFSSFRARSFVQPHAFAEDTIYSTSTNYVVEFSQGALTSFQLINTNAVRPIQVEGVFRIGASGGSFVPKLNFASVAAVNSVVTRNGSYMFVKRLGSDTVTVVGAVT